MSPLILATLSTQCCLSHRLYINFCAAHVLKLCCAERGLHVVYQLIMPCLTYVSTPPTGERKHSLKSKIPQVLTLQVHACIYLYTCTCAHVCWVKVAVVRSPDLTLPVVHTCMHVRVCEVYTHAIIAVRKFIEYVYVNLGIECTTVLAQKIGKTGIIIMTTEALVLSWS